MTNFGSSGGHCRRSGRARIWWGLLVLVLPAVAGFVLILQVPAAERALLLGKRLLGEGRADRAAAAFERAIELNPRLEDAWQGLLDARPEPAVCRRFANEFPELLDSAQPLQDPALLLHRGVWNAQRWERSFATYERVARAVPGEGAGADAELVRLDYEGRREVAAAWAEARSIEAELDLDMREPFAPGALGPLALYDLPAAKALVVQSWEHFKELKRWMKTCARLDAAGKACAAGEAKLRQAVERSPRFVPAQLTLAYMEMGRGDPAAAERRCRALLDAAAGEAMIPGELRTRCCLARALELQGRAADAADQIQTLLASRPNDADLLLRLGALHLKAGRTDDANAIADRLLDGNEFDTRPSYIKGVASLRRGEYETAVTQLTVALEYGVGDLGARYSLALAREKAGQHFSASVEFRRVAYSAADGGWPLAASAACALAAGQPGPASDAAGQLLGNAAALKAHPKLREYALRFQLAAAAMQGGRALDGFEVEPLVEAASETDLAHYLIAGVWAGQAYVASDADIPISDKQLDFFRARAGKEPSAAYCVAFLLAARGQAAQARDALKDLVAVHPDYVLATLHLARLYALEGRTEQALRAVEGLRAVNGPVEVTRTLALLGALQGATLPAVSPPDGSAAQRAALPGPHLPLLDMAVVSDPAAFARRLVMLDPVQRFPQDVLRLTYPHVRSAGFGGISDAVRANGQIGLMVQAGLAAYQTGESGLYRLAVGGFWNEIPADL